MLDHNAEIQRNKVNANLDLIKYHCYTKLIKEPIVLKGYTLYTEIGNAIGLTDEQCRAKHLVEGGTLENYLKSKINFYFTELKLNGLVEALGEGYWTMNDEGKQAKDAMELEKLLEKNKKKKRKLTKEQIQEYYTTFCKDMWKPYHDKYLLNNKVNNPILFKNKVCGLIQKNKEGIVLSILNDEDMNEVLTKYYGMVS